MYTVQTIEKNACMNAMKTGHRCTTEHQVNIYKYELNICQFVSMAIVNYFFVDTQLAKRI